MSGRLLRVEFDAGLAVGPEPADAPVRSHRRRRPRPARAARAARGRRRRGRGAARGRARGRGAARGRAPPAAERRPPGARPLAADLPGRADDDGDGLGARCDVALRRGGGVARAVDFVIANSQFMDRFVAEDARPPSSLPARAPPPGDRPPTATATAPVPGRGGPRRARRPAPAPTPTRGRRSTSWRLLHLVSSAADATVALGSCAAGTRPSRAGAGGGERRR